MTMLNLRGYKSISMKDPPTAEERKISVIVYCAWRR
jgi:hypothetical protein